PTEKLEASTGVPRIIIVESPELPLDGDGIKWANRHSDKNVAPWSRAIPQVLTLAGPQVAVDGESLNKRGGIGYLLHSPRCLYAAAIALAPEHVFSDDRAVYNYSVMELFVGPTQICTSQNRRGLPAYYFHGTPLLPPGVAALRSRVTLFDQPPAWPDIELLRLPNRAGLQVCFFELEVPWDILDIPRPTPDHDLPVALALGFPNPVTNRCLLQLVMPGTFEFERPATYAHARLRTATHVPLATTDRSADGTDRITVFPQDRKPAAKRIKITNPQRLGVP
ncbi:MAG: hypothetical protein WCI73_12350, partial [Phycisphaerae bacterium]